jgi:hypothetical protein
MGLIMISNSLSFSCRHFNLSLPEGLGKYRDKGWQLTFCLPLRTIAQKSGDIQIVSIEDVWLEFG